MDDISLCTRMLLGRPTFTVSPYSSGSHRRTESRERRRRKKTLY